jgi:endonuclease YncB( thermonuclease family)
MRKPLEFDAYPDALAQRAPFGPYKAVCSRIVDGDTIYALVDVGFNEYAYRVIRFEGINAPELHTGDQRAAGAAARDYLAGLIPPGTPIVLDARPDTLTFGRYVARVWALRLDDQPYDVGAAMVAAGHAVPVAE